MLDVFAWLLAVELLGLLAFPIVYVLTPWLPDRGYTLAKPIGLLLAFYPLWLLASSRVVPNSLFTLLLILAVIAVVSVRMMWRRQSEMQEFLRREWRVLLLSEAVFLGMFAVWAMIRAYDAAISHTEQPMDFAFFNASVISHHFPPEDPWLAGESVSYYYFGYLIFGGLTRLAGVSTAVGYNLALALVAGLAAAGIFSLGVNVVRLVGGSLRGAVLTGLAGVFLLLSIANLESGLEFVRASGNGSPEFWEWVDIKDLAGPSKSSHWYPSEGGWWWWRATRVIDTVENGRSLDYTITEFPFFSFFLGDLHPHVMSLPFVLAFAGLVLNLFVSPARLGLRQLRSNLRETAVLALALGALGFINLWDLPVFAALFAAASLLRGYRQRGTLIGAVAAASPLVVVVVPLATVLFLPFYGTIYSWASGVLPEYKYIAWSLAALFIATTLGLNYRQRRTVKGAVAAAAPAFVAVLPLAVLLYLPFHPTFDSQARGVLPVEEHVSRPFHFLVIWGLFLFIAVPFLAWELVSALRGRPRRWQEGAIAAAVALLPWLAWLLAEVGIQVVSRLASNVALPFGLEELLSKYATERGPLQIAELAWRRFLHLLPLMLMMAAVVYVVLRRARVPVAASPAPDSSSPGKGVVATTADGDSQAQPFPLLLLALAVLLLMGLELFYVLDIFGNRMNTVFKLSYQAWALLALACSYALYYLGSRYIRTGPWLRLAGYGWIGILVVAVLASVYYPASAVQGKTSGQAGGLTLDGLAYVARSSIGELRGIQWLGERYQAGDRIIEAVGNDYSDYGRVSASTGIPTVLGWIGHEEQWRGSRALFQGREEAVRQFYQTSSPQEAEEILQRYGVTYIFVGPRERARYGAGGLAKLDALADVVFQEGDVVIYRVRG